MSSAVRPTLQAYVAGRVPPQRVVAVVAEAYYGDRGMGNGEWLRPLVEIIERAHPGVIRLAGIAARPGFAVELTERPFPKQYESDLKRAAETILLKRGDQPQEMGGGTRPIGLVGRLVEAVRRLFSASA